ncbi:MAG: killer suppression protein [Gemmatimonadetes bacterium]|nr:killer suppression protein [Gemmatimonadota bacterium]
MEVRFATSQLQKTMSGSSTLNRRFGDIGARKIRTRLSQLEAADSLADLRSLPGRWHELTGDRAGHLAADLHQPFRMVLRPAEPVPRTDDGSLDWARVTTVIITEIADYH